MSHDELADSVLEKIELFIKVQDPKLTDAEWQLLFELWLTSSIDKALFTIHRFNKDLKQQIDGIQGETTHAELVRMLLADPEVEILKRYVMLDIGFLFFNMQHGNANMINENSKP